MWVEYCSLEAMEERKKEEDEEEKRRRRKKLGEDSNTLRQENKAPVHQSSRG